MRNMNSARSGLTLIEIIIFNAILATFMAASFLVAYSTIAIANQSKARIEVAQNVEFAFKKIEAALSSGKQVTVPSVGTSGSTFVIEQYSGDSPTIFSLNNGAVTISKAGGVTLNITNSRVKITGFSIEHRGTALNPSAIKVSISAESALELPEARNISVSASNFYIVK